MNIEDLPEDAVVFEDPDYQTALIGITHDGRAVYDFDKMVAYLVHKEGMSEEDAIIYIDFNTIGALGCDSDSPVIVHTHWAK